MTRFVLALLLALLPTWASAQSYPDRFVRLIVPFAPGQGADAAARIVAEQVSRNLGQPVVIENRPGAGGNIGADAVAKATPDGYTLLVGSNGTHAANAALYPSLTFDPLNDFIPLAFIGSVPMVLVTRPDYAASTTKALIDAAKAKPESINVAIPSSTARVVFELLQNKSQAKLFPVAYKASNTALSDLLGNHVDLAIDTVIATTPQVQAGKLKALAVSSATRSLSLPDVPTFVEGGLAGFDLAAWNIWLAPKGTPDAVVSKLNKAINAALQDKDVQEKLLKLGYIPGGKDDTATVAAFVRTETTKWGDLIRQAGIKAE
jgi:tripartite-type tricarboxylate transporter receptor subunit TctC